jgi:hypothetical protein
VIGACLAGVGLVMVSVAVVWIFGPWGLAAAGVCWVALGVAVDFERLVTHGKPASSPLLD